MEFSNENVEITSEAEEENNEEDKQSQREEEVDDYFQDPTCKWLV